MNGGKQLGSRRDVWKITGALQQVGDQAERAFSNARWPWGLDEMAQESLARVAFW